MFLCSLAKRGNKDKHARLHVTFCNTENAMHTKKTWILGGFIQVAAFQTFLVKTGASRQCTPVPQAMLNVKGKIKQKLNIKKRNAKLNMLVREQHFLICIPFEK